MQPEAVQLAAGSIVVMPNGHGYTIGEELAAKFQPGDRIVASAEAGLLHIPAAELASARKAVDGALAAFDGMRSVTDEQVQDFYRGAVRGLEDDAAWDVVVDANERDVQSAKARKRSTTRLAVSDAMRSGMIDGLRAWAQMPSPRGSEIDSVSHEGFRVDMVGEGLGVVGFVFEGRPNVVADACGLLRSGNCVVFRVGSDALGTARAILERVIVPSLRGAGVPAGAVSLVDSPAHAAGWALFLDHRLSLAVARGSGAAVRTLGALAQSVGTPVSQHGTGGAWMFVAEDADEAALHEAVLRSLDRKVCNTLNTLCLLRGEAPGAPDARRASVALQAIGEAGRRRGQSFKLHVVAGSEGLVPAEMFDTDIEVARAGGACWERQAVVMAPSDLGTEWEWEDTPEVSLFAARRLEDAVAVFNSISPRLVASLISRSREAHEAFFRIVDAPFVGDGHTRWVDGQFALGKPELGLSNWEQGRLFGRSGILTGDTVYTVRTRYRTAPVAKANEAKR